MIIFDLINRDNKIGLRALVGLGCLSGLSNALIMAIVNTTAEHVSDEGSQTKILYYMALFILVIVIYGLTQRHMLVKATYHVEYAIRAIRQNLFSSIRRCELQTIERLGKERIFTIMGKELQVVSQSAQLFVVIAQSGILVLFASLYVAYLSLPAFFIVAICIGSGAYYILLREKDIEQELTGSFHQEHRLNMRLTDILSGFKEVKISRPRAEELQQDFNSVTSAILSYRKKILSLFASNFVWSQLSFYVALGAIVFLLPVITEAGSDTVTEVSTATLFLVGPIMGIIGGLPNFISSNEAARNVMRLERELMENARPDEPGKPIKDFREIELRDIWFQHDGGGNGRKFQVGPINLKIKKGQKIFVTGGNGSGKTTFIRLLTGLYQPQQGQILLDGYVVDDDQLNAFRNLFSAVFSDFHLFHKLYGIEDPEETDIDEWLAFLEMKSKVKLQHREFSTTELSTGQRKRLALLAAVFEKRSIYIFDEWAADQDPAFRRKFYREVLPRLTEDGQTVIAITHDDKFFDMADIRIVVDKGKISIPETGSVG